MVGVIGEADSGERQKGMVSQVMSEKLAPVVLGMLAYFLMQFIDGERSDSSQTAQRLGAVELQMMALKTSVDSLVESDKGRWTRADHDRFAAEIERRNAQQDARLQSLETER